MPLCTQCILPADTAGITLDDTGVCSHCRAHQPIEYHGEEELQKLLDSVRDRGNKYDCMINISGGRDSSYTLLSLVKDYGMKALAVNYANPFTDPRAKQNIDNIVRLLDVDFVQFKLKRNLHEKILKNNILAWFKKPTPAMIPAICIGCKIIWPKMLRIARKNDIHCIVNGGNPYEYTSFKKELLGISQDTSLTSTYLGNIRGLAREAVRNIRYLKPKFIPATLKGYLFGNPYAVGSRLVGGKIAYLDFFHYIPWDEEKVIGRIQAELDWDYPHELNSTWRFDCQIAHLKDFMYVKTLGVIVRSLI